MIKQIFEKIGSGQPLNLQEQSEFASFGERLQLLENGFGSTIRQGALQAPAISSPVWKNSPTHAFFAYTTSPVLIATSTWTQVTFFDAHGQRDLFDFVDSNKNSIKIGNTNLFFDINGNARWQPNSLGNRAVRVRFYSNTAGVLLSMIISNISSLPTAGLPLEEYPVQSWSVCVDNEQWISNLSDYFIVEVFQNSGSSITMEALNFTIKVV